MLYLKNNCQVPEPRRESFPSPPLSNSEVKSRKKNKQNKENINYEQLKTLVSNKNTL